MKKSIFLAFLLFALVQIGYSQIDFGIKAGVSSLDFSDQSININNLDNDLELAIENAHYGFYGGFFLNAYIGPLILNPEIAFSSVNVDYSLKDLGNAPLNSIKSDKYSNIDFPLLVGLKLGFLQLKGGPVGHAHLSSASDLFDISGYDENFDNISWGWQAGIGIKFWKLLFEVRYEKNRDNFGSHFLFDNVATSFDDKSTRYIATVGFIL